LAAAAVVGITGAAGAGVGASAAVPILIGAGIAFGLSFILSTVDSIIDKVKAGCPGKGFKAHAKWIGGMIGSVFKNFATSLVTVLKGAVTGLGKVVENITKDAQKSGEFDLKKVQDSILDDGPVKLARNVGKFVQNKGKMNSDTQPKVPSETETQPTATSTS
jgi:hypothetical protein